MLLCVFFTVSLPARAEVPLSSSEVSLLAKNVKVKGWSQKRKRALFRKVLKRSDTIALNATNPIDLTHNKYAHFYAENNIRRAKAFVKKWRSLFRKAQHKYGVNKEVVVAILLVETQLGSIGGSYPVVSVFSSIYVDAHALLKEGKLEQKMQERVKKKQQWALEELRALLKINLKYGKPVEKLTGSYAGAFGMCQFLPSSYLNYAVKAFSEDKMPLLDFEPHAIFSTANYLMKHGFKSTRRLQHLRNRAAVFAYNNSGVYVDTVLGVAQKIREL